MTQKKLMARLLRARQKELAELRGKSHLSEWDKNRLDYLRRFVSATKETAQ